MRPLVITIRRVTDSEPGRQVFTKSPVIIARESDATLRLPDGGPDGRVLVQFDEQSATLTNTGAKDYILLDLVPLGIGRSRPISEATSILWAGFEIRIARGAPGAHTYEPGDVTAFDPDVPRKSKSVEGTAIDDVLIPVLRPVYPRLELARTEVSPPPKAPHVPLPPGTKFGRYETVELLGTGGMGAVYKGWDPAVHRSVAIKVLSPETAARPEVVERFKLEAKSAGQITHINVVDIYDVGLANGLPYIVMEFLMGEEVGTLLSRRKLEITEAVDIVLDACAGVGAMHDAGVVHRDLTPRNLFVAKHRMGKLTKVVDFGIAKLASGGGAKLTTAGMVVGTKHYMAPEQTRADGEIDARTDQFTLGVVLYECLTGDRPHEGRDRNAIVVNIRTGKFIPPRSRRAEIPRDLEAIVLRAMALQPEDRFPSVYDLGVALAAFASPLARSRWSLTGGPQAIATTNEAPSVRDQERDRTAVAGDVATRSVPESEYLDVRKRAARGDVGAIGTSEQATRQIPEDASRELRTPPLSSDLSTTKEAASRTAATAVEPQVAAVLARAEKARPDRQHRESARLVETPRPPPIRSDATAVGKTSQSAVRAAPQRGGTPSASATAVERPPRKRLALLAAMIAVIGGGAWVVAQTQRHAPTPEPKAMMPVPRPEFGQPVPSPPLDPSSVLGRPEPAAAIPASAARPTQVVDAPEPTARAGTAKERGERRHHHREQQPTPAPVEYTPNGTPILH